MARIMEETSSDPAGEVEETFAANISFGNIISAANWQPPGEYYQTMPASARAAVSEVVESDERLRQELRHIYFPALKRQGTLKLWERANPRYLRALQERRIFSGQVFAADATVAKYETLSLVGAQIAVSRVSYQGSTGQIVSNIMHWGKELPRQTTAADIAAAIRSRGKELKNKINNEFLYAIALYKEREVLLESPKDSFKLIQGTIFPKELLAGSGTQHTMEICFALLGALIDEGNYATIVSHDSHRELVDLGFGLDAGEYAVVETGDEVLETFFHEAHYTDTPIPQYGGKTQKQVFRKFQAEYGSRVVRGVLRAHPMSPPYVFYCNADRIHEAVHILLADAANTGPRGFPLLLDLADQYCSGAFKASEYSSHLNAEFARASGGSGMYQSERTTRD